MHNFVFCGSRKISTHSGIHMTRIVKVQMRAANRPTLTNELLRYVLSASTVILRWLVLTTLRSGTLPGFDLVAITSASRTRRILAERDIEQQIDRCVVGHARTISELRHSGVCLFR